ncbi:LacI family DNA-binding transcriptional regulator [Mycobacterium stomatepiae]|nr:LacI family DNA-binding transcriptional regulator [Mycobacterium stomatepiae]MCV7165994.1 LacI family DNA-binding transcriptional regulator [Mycobacterium stomatepiae]
MRRLRREVELSVKGRPTKADVARRANVSTATVSYVLNNSVGRTISAQTRAAVHSAAAELGYRPNLAARNLARGKSGVILYIVPRLAGGEMPMQVGTHMTTELARRGIMQVQLFETEQDDAVVDAINHLQPIAVTSLFPLGRKASGAVADAAIPHICVHTLPGLQDPQYSVGQMRVDHLVSRGHRNVAFAYSGDRRWRALGDYWIDGVRRAAHQRGLPEVAVKALTPDDSAKAVGELHAAGVTAVCAQSDEVAFVVLNGVRRAGLRCPDDLAVIGVDATALSPFSVPALTTVVFDREAIAEVALSAVLTELGLPDGSPADPRDIATLVIREST